MKMKEKIRLFIRYIIGVKDNETISDALNRKKYRILKKINMKSFDKFELKNILEGLGLEKGDIVIVHSAWRAFIGFKGKPEDVIDTIYEIIGDNGTILMPAFSENKNEFHYNDNSCAGVLSEVFRTKYNIIRSLDTNFSMIGIGKSSNDLLLSHIDSYYYFDENSPYYKSIKRGAKILLLGLGKKPHKITLFHCITYELRNILSCYKNIYTLKKKVKIFDENNHLYEKEIVDRNPRFQNNKKKFRKLFKYCTNKKNYAKINFLDIYLFEALSVYEEGKEYIQKKNYCLYKQIIRKGVKS